jgi:hypothetical protein
MDVTNFLVALSFLIPILCPLGGIETLLEKLQGLIEIVLVLELNSDNLIHSD